MPDEFQRIPRPDTKRASKLEMRARAWRHDPRLEKAIAIRDSASESDRSRYHRLGPAMRIQVGHYELGKHAAKQLGLHVGGDSA